MYARVARFEGGDPARMDEVIEANREMIEAGLASPPEGLEDAQATWVLVDRQAGRGLGITFFATEDGMRRGDRALDTMSPSGPAADAGGRRTSVELYEVVIRAERS